MADNPLYYGDNLDILPRYNKDESVDLVYLDPPFIAFHLKWFRFIIGDHHVAPNTPHPRST
jgi:16S rRNA G966 N2-methylase RsmD